jgi:hypothetical protein
MSTSSGWPLRRAASAKGDHDSPVVAFAVCLGCGVDIDGWRERLLPILTGSLVVTDHGELALDVEREDVCLECGGDSAEIRVGARHHLCS